MNAFQNKPSNNDNWQFIYELTRQLVNEADEHDRRLTALIKAIELENQRHHEAKGQLERELNKLGTSGDRQSEESIHESLPAGLPTELRGSVVYMGDIISPIDVKWDAEE
jgi:hypothetical protein